MMQKRACHLLHGMILPFNHTILLRRIGYGGLSLKKIFKSCKFSSIVRSKIRNLARCLVFHLRDPHLKWERKSDFILRKHTQDIRENSSTSKRKYLVSPSDSTSIGSARSAWISSRIWEARWEASSGKELLESLPLAHQGQTWCVLRSLGNPSTMLWETRCCKVATGMCPRRWCHRWLSSSERRAFDGKKSLWRWETWDCKLEVKD